MLVFGQQRQRRIIGMEPIAAQHMALEQHEQRFGDHAHHADLVGKGREAERHAFGGEAVALAVERLVQAVFLEDEAGEEVRAEHAARGDVERCRRLADRLATAAGDLLADGADDLVTGGYLFEGLDGPGGRWLSASEPQHGHCAGAGMTTSSRGRSAGKSRRGARWRTNGATAMALDDAIALSSSAAAASASSAVKAISS